MPKFANLANEKIIEVIGFVMNEPISLGFVMNEPSDSMNDGAEFAFFLNISFKVLQRFLLSFIFVSLYSFLFFLFSLVT